jgi:hypothetical protein
VACPDRKVVVLESDGSGLYSPQSLWTIAHENLDLVVLVFANNRYQILRNEMPVNRIVALCVTLITVAPFAEIPANGGRPRTWERVREAASAPVPPVVRAGPERRGRAGLVLDRLGRNRHQAVESCRPAVLRRRLAVSRLGHGPAGGRLRGAARP